jgi:hypothetical protein
LSNLVFTDRHYPKTPKIKNMKEFVMIIRLEQLPEKNFSPDEMQAGMAVWEKWVDDIIARNILVSRGNRLGDDGRTIRNGKIITNGPYVETKEIIGGYLIIRANSIDEAAQIAKSAPLVGIGSIEIRGLFAGNN